MLAHSWTCSWAAFQNLGHYTEEAYERRGRVTASSAHMKPAVCAHTGEPCLGKHFFFQAWGGGEGGGIKSIPLPAVGEAGHLPSLVLILLSVRPSVRVVL